MDWISLAKDVGVILIGISAISLSIRVERLRRQVERIERNLLYTWRRS
jgi:hypothetical protein